MFKNYNTFFFIFIYNIIFYNIQYIIKYNKNYKYNKFLM